MHTSCTCIFCSVGNLNDLSWSAWLSHTRMAFCSWLALGHTSHHHALLTIFSSAHHPTSFVFSNCSFSSYSPLPWFSPVCCLLFDNTTTGLFECLRKEAIPVSGTTRESSDNHSPFFLALPRGLLAVGPNPLPRGSATFRGQCVCSCNVCKCCERLP